MPFLISIPPGQSGFEVSAQVPRPLPGALLRLCLVPQPGKDSRWLPSLVLARLVFVPLLLLCNVKPRRYLTVVFEHDAWFIFFMAAFAFSNGYLASLCMCFGPK